MTLGTNVKVWEGGDGAWPRDQIHSSNWLE